MEEFEGWFHCAGDGCLESILRRNQKSNPNAKLTDYQFDRLSRAIAVTKNFKVALDIGAHYGLMSYHLSKYFETVYAFEPVPSVYKCLEKNIETHNLSNVKPLNIGLGKAEKSMLMKVSTGKSLGSHVVSQKDDEPNCSFEIVEIFTLDSFGFKDVGLIKMDVEGYETLILESGLKVVNQDKPAILFEKKNLATRYGYTANSTIEFLSKQNYIIDTNWKKDALMVYNAAKNI